LADAQRIRPRRPWVIPPALLHLPFELLRGTTIVHETPNELGLGLWLLHREVELWAATDPDDRPKLFRVGRPSTPTRFIPPAITSSLAALRTMLARDTVVDGEAACQAIARWATPRAPATALLFAQAGAMLAPRIASAAQQVAVYANDAGYASLAINWANRALALARATQNWHDYAAALIEIARANCAAGGDVTLARSSLVRVLRVHRRNGLHPDLRARALLNLFRLALGATETTASTTARLQRAALRCYASSDRRRADVLIALLRSLSEVGRHADATELMNGYAGVLTPKQADEVRRLFAAPVPPASTPRQPTGPS